jgi:HTH-type transcriptional regulator/antitoxin HipB
MRIRNPRDLGLTVRDRRRALGLDQASLAKRVGVSRQWIIALEKGKRSVELALVLRTLTALDLRLTADADTPRPVWRSIDTIVDGSGKENSS